MCLHRLLAKLATELVLNYMMLAVDQCSYEQAARVSLWHRTVEDLLIQSYHSNECLPAKNTVGLPK
jgi:hypothetical protein